MKPLPFILLAISLPLLLGGCGEKGVNYDELEEREGIYYVSGSDTPYTGKTFSLYETGKKEMEGYLKDGKGDGLAVRWFENGQKQLEVNMKDGKQDGLQTRWYENGQKEMEENFKDGKPDGLALQWHENGQKSGEGNYKDGKIDGLAVTWHENGQKKSEVKFKDGKIISTKYWNSKGEPVDTYEEANK